MLKNHVFPSFQFDSGSSPFEPSNNGRSRSTGIGTQGAFPDDGDPPALLAQLGNDGRVPFTVSAELRSPEFGLGRRQLEVGTPAMRMPKTAVHKYDCSPLWQDKVRSAFEVGWMQPIPVPRPPKVLAQQQFRLGVLSPDARHQGGALVGTHHISHSERLNLVSCTKA